VDTESISLAGQAALVLFTDGHTCDADIGTDPAFRAALLADPQVNLDGDGVINPAEALVVRVLDLRAKGIRDLSGIGTFFSLQELYAGDNLLTELPAELVDLLEMRVLNLEKNHLTQVPDLNNLTLLERLDLSDNRLQTVPAISTLDALWDLNLAWNVLVDILDLEENANLGTDASHRIDLTHNFLDSGDCPTLAAFSHRADASMAMYVYNPQGRFDYEPVHLINWPTQPHILLDWVAGINGDEFDIDLDCGN